MSQTYGRLRDYSLRQLARLDLLKQESNFRPLLRLPIIRAARQTGDSAYQLITRSMSTMQTRPGSSGTPISSEQEAILADSKANKRVKINACGQLYSQLAKTKPSLYASAPKKVGIDFQVSYYDSNDKLAGSPLAPVVCLLHGAPGHYTDFASLISYLTGKGVRVVAPNFPDYSVTYEYSFRHSPVERLDFLLSFFRAIQVTKIDMLVGHSSAVYTIFELLNFIHTERKSAGLQVDSIGLFNTPSYNLPPSLAVTPLRLFTLKLFDYPLCRPIIKALIHVFVKVQGIRNRVDASKIENFLIAVSAVGYSESANMSEYLKLVRKCQIPTFVLVGEKDKILPMSCFEQLKHDLGVASDRQVKMYKNGELIKDVEEEDDLVKVSQFDTAGHYAFQRFPDQVNNDVHNFLRWVLEEKDNSLVTKL